MSQTTLDDDELFGEAASEMRTDVESSLVAARAELPSTDEIWQVQGENILGVLNALRSALAVGDARTHLRDAKKWFTMGKRAGAFDDADDLADEIGELERLIDQIEEARDRVAAVVTTIPDLRSLLENVDTALADDESDDT